MTTATPPPVTSPPSTAAPTLLPPPEIQEGIAVSDDDPDPLYFTFPSLTRFFTPPRKANEREVIAVLKLVSHFARNFPGIFFPILKFPITRCKYVIEVPNNKVGVLIGKAGDTIGYLQYNLGAKIQITRDADADPNSSIRPVELIGSLESVNKAEQLIKDVIAESTEATTIWICTFCLQS